jgi:hypothetical protein
MMMETVLLGLKSVELQVVRWEEERISLAV